METAVPRLVVTNIVVSGFVEGVDIYDLIEGVYDDMGGLSKKKVINISWRGKYYRAVINMWRTNSILIRIVPQEEQEGGGYIDVESDKDIIELVNEVGKELLMLIADRLGYRRYIEIVTHREIATKLNIQNIVTQAMLPRCVDLDKLYIYIEGARPACFSARYRSSRGRGLIPPALLIYCETPSYRVTVELFRTGRFQAKGASKLSDLEEVVKKMISIIEVSGSYSECI
ncbi:MAG: hypothetical protein QXI64_10305 [Sulfolobales archaeon]